MQITRDQLNHSHSTTEIRRKAGALVDLGGGRGTRHSQIVRFSKWLVAGRNESRLICFGCTLKMQGWSPPRAWAVDGTSQCAVEDAGATSQTETGTGIGTNTRSRGVCFNHERKIVLTGKRSSIIINNDKNTSQR